MASCHSYQDMIWEIPDNSIAEGSAPVAIKTVAPS